MVVEITLTGGVRLDTDGGTKVGFKYEGGVMGLPKGGASRSYDLSVPATDNNCAAFNISQSAETEGVRNSTPARLACGGAVMDGRIYLKRWAGRRFELLFVYNVVDTLSDRLDEPINRLIQDDVVITVSKGDELDTGVIKPFGFYHYVNNLTTHGSPTIGDELTSMPSTNLRWLVEHAAATLGLGVTWNNNGSDYEQPENFGILLPTANTTSWNSYSITGSAVNGFSPAVPPWLHFATRRVKRGPLGANKTAYVYEAVQPCSVRIDNVGDNYVVDGDTNYGRYILANPGEAFLRNLQTGESFIIVNKDERKFMGAAWWWASNGFEANIDPVTMMVGDIGTTAAVGGTLNLRDNLPDLTLRQLLDTYCLLTCSTWYPNAANTGIEVTTYAYRIADQSLYAELDGMKVTEVESVQRYIDGYANHNILTCKSLGEEDMAPDRHFRRDYFMDNDYLENEAQYGEIPLWDGYALDSCNPGMYSAYFDDAATDADNGVVLTPRLGIFFANLYNDCDGEALHVSTIDAYGEVGKEFKELLSQSLTVRVRIAASLLWFAGLKPVSVVRWRGRDYIVKDGSWGDGIAQLSLVRLPVTQAAIVPPPPPEYTDLEYIESTGTQYIDTGIGVAKNIETFATINYPSLPPDTYNYGVFYNTAVDILAVNYRVRNFGNLDFGGTAYQTPTLQLVTDVDYLIEQTTTEFAITNLLTSARAAVNIPAKTSGDATKHIYIFCINYRGTVLSFMPYKLKRFRIVIDNVTVFDGVPKLRTADSKPGLYDTVNDVFYTNAGTGEFLYA